MHDKTAKTGLSLLAAAGVAVGVIGISMGGASGSPVSCAPTHGSSDGNSSSSSNRSSDHPDASSVRGANRANGANGANGADGTGSGVDGAGDGSGTPVTDPTGTATDGSGTSIIVGADTPPNGSGADSGSSSDSGSNRPFLHVYEHTNSVSARGATVPQTGTSVTGRTNLLRGRQVDVHATQR